MAAPDRTHPGRPRTPATVTVAELLARQDAGTGPEAGAWESDPIDADDVPTQPTSVAALLRREGCGPHKADRPLLPRAHSRPATSAPEPSRRHVRKVTAAAGALFAVGAVFGSALVDNTLRPGSHPADDVTNTPAGDAGGSGESLRAFTTGAGAGGDAGAPVTGVTLTALLFAEAVPGSATGALEGADAFPWVDGHGPGAGETYRSSVFLTSKPSGSAEPIGAPADGTPPGGGAPGGGQAGPGSPSGPGGPGRGGPGGGGPGGPGGGPGEGPGSGGPGGGGPGGAGGPGGPGGPDTPAVPAPTVVLPLPEVSTPRVEVPGAPADVPVVGRVRTPAVAISEARVAPPQVAFTAGSGKAEVASSPAAVETPDLRLAEAEAGPLRVSRAEVAVPDVEVSAARVAASADAPPEVALPGVKVSGAGLTTPDVDLGDVELELPDAELPDVEIPAVGGEDSDVVADAGEAVGETVEEVGETAADTTEAVTSTVRSLGRAAALDQD